ncbi:hypothetical protein F0562_002467 [Nyssa sinensis]|uniref:Uncharacterized protein n=1 Tax=Nyssa sinensis TaxID=561372 RepID=A0A5J5C5Y5_9ASTE|nr:hypothetical protein F0562_002467 [Nyssa sinensis]
MNMIGAARTQAPTITNYDVGSATWTDLRRAPLPSAMEIANLGHGPWCSPIDPVQSAAAAEPRSLKMGQQCSGKTKTTIFKSSYHWIWQLHLR